MEKSISSKCCISCGLEKELSEFYKNSKAKDGLWNECKICTNKRSKKWAKENKNTVVEKQRIRREKDPLYKEKAKKYLSKNREVLKKKKRDKRPSRYGISSEEYQDLLKKQGSKCAICGGDNSDSR